MAQPCRHKHIFNLVARSLATALATRREQMICSRLPALLARHIANLHTSHKAALFLIGLITAVLAV